MMLKIVESSQKYFVQVSSVIEVNLVNQNHLLCCGHNIPLNILCFTYNNNYEEVDLSNSIVINDSNPNISNIGFTTIPIRFLKTSMENQNRPFYLKIFPKDRNFNIPSVTSLPIYVYRHQLTCNEAPDVWLKDQHGKESWISLDIKLQDNNGNLIKNRQVNLVTTLLYSDGTEVPKQNLLKYSGNMSIGKSGSTTIKFRILEVSRNHQKRKFKILISPKCDNDSTCSDICSVETTPIEVRSKIKVRNTTSNSTTSATTITTNHDNYDNNDIDNSYYNTTSLKRGRSNFEPIREEDIEDDIEDDNRNESEVLDHEYDHINKRNKTDINDIYCLVKEMGDRMKSINQQNAQISFLLEDVISKVKNNDENNGTQYAPRNIYQEFSAEMKNEMKNEMKRGDYVQNQVEENVEQNNNEEHNNNNNEENGISEEYLPLVSSHSISFSMFSLPESRDFIE